MPYADPARKAVADREYRQKNRERELVRVRRWRTANREKEQARLREKARRQRETNPEPLRQAQRRWREANLQKARAAQREYYEANREDIRAAARAKTRSRESDRLYRAQNREYVLDQGRQRYAATQNQTRQSATTTGPYTAQEDSIIIGGAMTLKQTALVLGRTYTSVRQRWSRLSVR